MKLSFGGFVLDREAGRLTGPEGEEVRLRPQAFRMLEVLVEAAPRILSQEELLDRVWGVEHLSPASVKQAVSEVRQALGDDPARPTIVETVHRRGYRWIAPVSEVAEPEPAPEPESPPAPEPAPPPARRRLPRAAVAFAAVLVLAVVSVIVLAVRVRPSRSTAARTAARPAPARPAVAILGFKNLSGDPGQDWISSALTEILAFELAAPGRVRLIPADSVARMKRELAVPYAESHSPRSLAAIGRNLGTDRVVAGSYLTAGGKLRIQVLAQDVHSGETVAWARETGPPEALMDLATAAARGLQDALGGPGAGSLPEAAAVAANAGSLRLYSEATARLRLGDGPGAVPLLERAAAVDPRNPLVQDALAGAYRRLGYDAQAKDAARRALELAAGLPREIRLGLEGRSREVRGEWAEAVALYSALRRLHPDDLEAGLRLAAAQTAAGHSDQAFATVAALRRLPRPAGADPRLDLAEGDAAFERGGFARSRDAAARAVAEAGRRGATQLVADGRYARGWALHRLGKEDEALADLGAARDLYARTGDLGAAAGARMAEGSVLRALGRTAEARRAYETTLAELREIGDRGREAKALNNLGSLLGDLGDYARVTALMERSLAIKREVRDRHGEAVTLANLGNLLRGLGDLAGARARLEEALAIQRSLGDAFGIAFDLRGLARVQSHEGRTAEALASLEEALATSRRIGDAEGAGEALLALGDLHRKAGSPERARDAYAQASAHFAALHQAGNEIYPLLNLATIDWEQGRLAAARAGFERAAGLARQTDNPFLEAHAHDGLAQTAEKRGDLAAARAEHGRALELWSKLGKKEEADRCRKDLARLGGGPAS